MSFQSEDGYKPVQHGGFHSAVVAQASGMISVQANCSLSHAVVLMVTRAQDTNSTLERLAIGVVQREIRFDPAIRR